MFLKSIRANTEVKQQTHCIDLIKTASDEIIAINIRKDTKINQPGQTQRNGKYAENLFQTACWDVSSEPKEKVSHITNSPSAYF